MAKSKFFRVAVEGVTTDGREITRDWIRQMAATYNRDTYGARIFNEHIRGIIPDGPFRAFGDVTAVKAEEISDGDLKGRLALYAQIEPSDAMVSLINSGQKIYTSIEVDSSFADTKLPYLVGLGITDSPASLGTEVLAFAAQHPAASPFRARKQRPENLFTAAAETTIELEDETSPADPTAGVFAKLNALLEKFTGKDNPAPAPAPAPDPAVNNGDLAAFAAAVTEAVQQLGQQTAASHDTLRAEMATHRQQVDAALGEFRQALDTTPANTTSRPPATGGNGAVVTNC